MKYLAFDLEIARDLDRIPFKDFQPVIGEKVEVDIGIESEITWRKGAYEGDGILATPEKTFDMEGRYWHPVDNKDWKRFRPLGITCAAAVSSDDGLWNWWAQKPDGRFADKISRGMCQALVANLQLLVRNAGYTLLTWNGLGFDFDVLAEESGMHTECKDLALNHIDMMFHFFCSRGYPLKLDAAAKGMGLPGKPEGMDGAIAPRMWADGEYHRVLDYVSRDGKNTLGVAQAVDNAGHLGWTARSGRPNIWHCDRWLTAKEAMALPKPDTSWMTDPWPRSKFNGWTGAVSGSPSFLTSDDGSDQTSFDPEDWTVTEADADEEAREIEEGDKPPLFPFDPTGAAQWDPDEGTWPIDGPDET